MPLGPSWGHLGAILGLPGATWGHLGPSWGRFGAILEPSWGHLGLQKPQTSLWQNWLVAAGFWLLAAGCWLLAAGCWLLASGCWLRLAACKQGGGGVPQALSIRRPLLP